MKIADVLAFKDNSIETTAPTTPLVDLARHLSSANIASVVVMGSLGRPLGLVTDRMIIETIASDGLDASTAVAAEIMITPLPTCSPADSLSQIMERMTRKRLRHFVAVEADRMIGVVSIGDLVKYRLRDAEMETRVLRDLAALNLPAR